MRCPIFDRGRCSPEARTSPEDDTAEPRATTVLQARRRAIMSKGLPSSMSAGRRSGQNGQDSARPGPTRGTALWEGGLDMSSLEHAEAHEALLKCLEEDPARPKLPNLDAFLHPLLEAMDPENCIEEEYHPHNDSVYMWKGLRLLMNRGEMGTFDSACVIRHNAKEGGEKVIEAVLNARGGAGGCSTPSSPTSADDADNTSAAAAPAAAASAAAAADAVAAAAATAGGGCKD